MSRLRVVIGQLEVGWDPAGNSRRIISFLQAEASPGSLVVLPEAALSGYDDQLSGLASLDRRALASAVTAVAATAARRRLHVLCGSLLREHDDWYNAALYFGPAGERWIYRKVNLATHERGRLAAGSALPLLTLPAPTSPALTLPALTLPALTLPGVTGCPDASTAAPFRVGVQLCRELKYPEQWHVLARRGAQVLAYLTYAANPQIPGGVWRSHLVSRAAETQRFVLAANVAHRDQHCPSMVVTPRGEVATEATGTGPQALHAELDLTEVSGWLLSQQRSDVVAVSYAGQEDEDQAPD
jgi:predicted amidohydrolase